MYAIPLTYVGLAKTETTTDLDRFVRWEYKPADRTQVILTALKESGVRVLALALAAMVLLEGFPGPQAVPGAANAMGLLHAVLAQVLLAGTVAVAILTAPSWKRPPEHVGDYGWPSLRSLAVLLPVLVLTQVVLGAGFRQRISGLMPHIIGAMLVALLILIVCAFTLQQCPTHTILRAAAKTLMVATFAQIFLGIAAYTVRAIGPNADANAAIIAKRGFVTAASAQFNSAAITAELGKRLASMFEEMTFAGHPRLVLQPRMLASVTGAASRRT